MARPPLPCTSNADHNHNVPIHGAISAVSRGAYFLLVYDFETLTAHSGIYPPPGEVGEHDPPPISRRP